MFYATIKLYIIKYRFLTQQKKLERLTGHWPGMLKLVSSAKERAILLATLTLFNSATALRSTLCIHEDVSHKAKTAILGYTEALMTTEASELEAAEQKWKDTVEAIEASLASAEDSFLKTKDRLHPIERENQEQDIANKKERLHRIKNSKQKFISAIAKRMVKCWVGSILSQKGKGKGRTLLIDRGAESKLLSVLEEQMVAHARRRGVAEMERRLQRKQMRWISNKWLAENGKRLIKSYETARSWAKPRNKRTIQAKQHRGSNLFSHRKAEKTFTEEHVNLHYNRAHIKNYTRMLFSAKNKEIFQKYAIRHCIDDKAYLRCGTSEGFSRPAHTPITPADPTFQPSIPAYDFPEKCGYVAPGVHLIIRDMQESQSTDGRDRFSIEHATISVTCKPKILYSSSATNWSNDGYADRIQYPDEHEVAGTGHELPRSDMSPLIFIKDSAKQFLLTNIPKDYERCTQGGNHLKRECKRVGILKDRLESAVNGNSIVPEEVAPMMNATLTEAKSLLAWLDTNPTCSSATCRKKYRPLTTAITNLEACLSDIVPKYRPCDVQTSDAGPGVGTSEMIVRLRMVEHFMLNDLDFHCRMHYAPRDSKSHPVERVMASLNEAVGDGRFISPCLTTLKEAYSEEELFQMNSEKVKQAEELLYQKAAVGCAQQVAARYEGTSCMKTSIHAQAADPNDTYSQFWYDQEDMLTWHKSTTRQKQSVPGSNYYQFLQDTFSEHYVKYDNGVEGIRKQGNFRCPVEIKRVPPPVPDLFTTRNDGTWSYHTPETLPEPLHDVTSREVDDFCPRARLNKLIKNLGEVHLIMEKRGNTIMFQDINDTWLKITNELDQFVANVCGKDLKEAATKHAETVYIREVKKAINKKASKAKVTGKQLEAIKTGPMTLTIRSKNQ